jgi:hypothetical protein
MRISVVATALAIVAITSSSAHAEPTKVNGFIGDVPGGTGGAFTEPTAVGLYHGDANDPDDDKIYVAEGLASNSRIQRLDADGNFELAWGKDVVRSEMPGDRGTGYELCDVAASCKVAPAGAGLGELSSPTGIAVSPSSGHVYVFDGGNRRVQEFRGDGKLVRAWDIDLGTAQRDRSDAAKGAIAVLPSEPHDVLVADGATNRVLQFDANGGFVRAWGWGVADGARRFQVCVKQSACRLGNPPAGRGSAPPYWPNHIAADSEGVVYGSVFLGSIFDDRRARTRIERFDTSVTPEPPDATATLLPPFRTDDPTRLPPLDAPAPILTNGATEGLTVEPSSGDLLAINNPFGVSNLDAIVRPFAAEGRGRPRARVLKTLPFLQNVTGIAVTHGGNVTFLSSGTTRPESGASTFTGCARPAFPPEDCHGLVVLAPGSAANAVLAGPTTGVGSGAWVDPGGSARYRLQVSADGRSWTTVTAPRQVTGVGYEPVAATPAPDSLAPGKVHRTRLVVEKKTEAGVETTVSNLGVLVGSPE